MNATLQPSRLQDALRNDYNRIALASSVALSAALLHPAPLVVGLIAEVGYLVIMTTRPMANASSESLNQDRPKPAYQKSATTYPKSLSSISISRETVLPQLRVEMQDRFDHIESLVQVITVQANKNAPLFEEMIAKLDYLKDKYLLFALREEQFRERLICLVEESKQLAQDKDEIPSLSTMQRKPANHLHMLDSHRADTSVPDQWLHKMISEAHLGYEREVGEIVRAKDRAMDSDLAAQLEKRAQTLLRRNKSVDRIGKILTNLGYELHLLDTKISAVADEIRIRTIDQILSDISALVIQTDSMTRTLEEVEPLEALTKTAAA